MSLGQLPFDAVRLIAQWLDLDSLVRLHATMNLRIQNLLSHPGILSKLTITVSSTHPGELCYFISALRDVDSLVLASTLVWDPNQLPRLLPTLNPRHLVMGVFEVRAPMVDEHIIHSGLEPEGVARGFSGFCFPNLARLTPNLKTLHLAYLYQITITRARIVVSSDSIWSPDLNGLLNIGYTLNSVISLPPTLVSLRMHSSCAATPGDFIHSLPAGDLKWLTLDLESHHFAASSPFRFPLEHSLRIMPSLEILKIFGSGVVTVSENFMVPQTLVDLELASPTIFPLQLLNHPSIKSSSLLYFSLRTWLTKGDGETLFFDASTNIDFAKLLPSSLITLRLTLDEASKRISLRYTIDKLPINLTDLTLELNAYVPSVFHILHLLHSLTTFKLSYDSSRMPMKLIHRSESHFLKVAKFSKEFPPKCHINLTEPHFHFQMLPRRIEHLTLIGDCFNGMSEAHIADFPPGLKSLVLSACTLSWANFLRQQMPYCQITILAPIDAWDGPDAAEIRSEFANLWSSELDLYAFHQAVVSHYANRNIFMELNIRAEAPEPRHMSTETKHEFISSLLLRPLVSLNHGYNYFRNFEILHSALPNLQKLVIIQRSERGISNGLKSWLLPPLLTHLELSRQSISFGTEPFPPTLTYIKADCGYWTSGSLPKLELLPNLTYLDAPKWAFDGTSIKLSIKQDMKKCHTRIYGILDLDVVPFLTKKISRITRSNMRISLYYIVSGRLVDKATSSSEPVGSALRLFNKSRDSAKILRSLLQDPMPASKATDSYVNSDLLSESIGSVVQLLEEARQGRNSFVDLCRLKIP